MHYSPPMLKTKFSKNIQTVIDILQDEVRGDTRSALRKMSPAYTMTWVYETPQGKLFPRVKVSRGADLDDAYVIRGRQYEVIHISENQDTVMVELIESYPDPETRKIYRTPLVLVLEMKKGRIETGRHYCDPRLSYRHLTPTQIRKAFARTTKPLFIIK